MIVQALGLPGLSVLEFTHMLTRLGLTYGVVRNGRLERIVGRIANQPIYPVVFHTASVFMRTHKKFAKQRVVAFVLDNPYVLQHELQMPMAGATFTKSSVLFSQFSIKDLKEILIDSKTRTTPMHFERRVYSMTQEVLKLYSASSLSALQTFLYKIKDVETREFVSKTVKKWMCSDASFDLLEPRLKKFIPLKSIEALKTIVNTKNMKVFREAVRKAAMNPTKLAKVAKTYKVSAFDIKYLLSTTA